MKTRTIIITIIAIISISTTQAVGGWFGGSKLFPNPAIKVGIIEQVYEITSKYNNKLGEVTNVTDVKIHKKERFNQSDLIELQQKYYERGIEINRGLKAVIRRMELNDPSDNFEEELLLVVFTANFVAKGEKWKIGGSLVFTKYPKKSKITFLGRPLYAHSTVEEFLNEPSVIKFWSEQMVLFKTSIKYFEEVIVEK